MVDIPNYLESYGKEVGLPNLKFNEQSICSLCFDAKISVDIVYRKEQDQCIFAAPIIDLPSQGQGELLKKIMIENVFGMATAGCVFGIEKDCERIVVSYTFIASTFTFDLFKTVLGNFVDIVEEWQKKCEDMQLSSSSSGSDESFDVSSSNPSSNFQFV
jgi:hypothetical protein